MSILKRTQNYKCIFLFILCGFISSCEKKHMGPKYDVVTWEAMDSVGENYEKKYQLNFLNSGLGDLVDCKTTLWALSLTSLQKIELDEGKKLAKLMMIDLLKEYNENEVFKNYIKVFNGGYRTQKELFDNRKIGFKLAFWDENVDRPSHPYLAQIRLADEKVYFYYADEKTQALKEPPVAISMYDLLDKKLHAIPK